MADKTWKCSCCGQEKDAKEFYSSFSVANKYQHRITVCKDCVVDIYNEFLQQTENEMEAIYSVCRVLDCYFEDSLYYSARSQAETKNSLPVRIYFQKIASLPQYKLKTFKDSIHYNNNQDSTKDNVVEITKNDKKNEEDVLRILGYDPFESENIEDRKYLCNRLIDYLDESTLEDSFKLSSCIELVKTFNQLDKLNMAIASLTINSENIVGNVAGMKSLIDAKNKLYSSALGLAKDNAISVNNSNNKSKGAGTLSGIIKKLQERGFAEADVNLFDVETARGIRQVADISNESIKKQLMFDENDYNEMINQQRDMISDLDKKAITLEEENRLLKLKLVGDSHE